MHMDRVPDQVHDLLDNLVDDSDLMDDPDLVDATDHVDEIYFVGAIEHISSA